MTVLILLFLLTVSESAYSIDEINKKLRLKENHSHLLYFDEEILRYKAGSEGVFDIEILPNIYDNRHEMLVKPVKPVNTNLIVWTKERIYKFDISIKEINKGYSGFDFFEIDLPPGLE